MPAKLTLVVRTADGGVKSHQLGAGTFTLGREADCDVVVASDDVSRHHVRLILHEGDFQIVDLGSTLGTKLNGQALRGPQRAPYPAMLQLGSVNLSVKVSSGEADLPRSAEKAAPPLANPDAGEPYEFGHEIARGGMGSILEAEDRKLGRKVAVKIMLSERDADEGHQKRFVHEAAVLGRLEHPNIVPIHDIGRDSEGQLYYSMKLVKGRTLQAILNGLREGDVETVREYTPGSLLTIFRKVCDAMAFAHANDIIHRDLKPENVMVGEFGEVLVMDWGLAKFLQADSASIIPLARSGAAWEALLAAGDSNFGMTMDGEVMGTPQYMSPEQAEGRIADMDARSDIWSLGGILYAILTLRPPVEGKSLEEVLQKVASGSITLLNSLAKPKQSRPKNDRDLASAVSRPVPPALGAVTMKALSVAREKRYPKVAALSSDIEAYQNGFATSAENAGAWKQFSLFVKRNKTASIGIAAVLLVGGVLGTKAILEGKRAGREAVRANAALASLKKSAPALRQLAENEAGLQHFDSALDKLDAAIALDSEYLPGYWRRAWLFTGMGRLADAAAATRLARQKDSAHDGLAAILPTLETLAALPPSAPWPGPSARRLWDHLVQVGASGEIIALLPKLTLSGIENEKLVRRRMDEWLGPGRVKVFLGTSGLAHVELKSIPIDTVEPLRGLPIDDVDVDHTNVSSLEPLRGLHLVRVCIGGTPVADLSPLRGMPLRSIELWDSKVTDLSPLRGAPLEQIACDRLGLKDLSLLRGAPLRSVIMRQNLASDLKFLADSPIAELDFSMNYNISDLSPLRGKPLKRLTMTATDVADLSPLRGAPLENLNIHDNKHIKDLTPLLDLPKLERLRVSKLGKLLEPLRHHPSLKYMACEEEPFRPVAQFWAEYDRQQTSGKK